MRRACVFVLLACAGPASVQCPEAFAGSALSRPVFSQDTNIRALSTDQEEAIARLHGQLNFAMEAHLTRRAAEMLDQIGLIYFKSANPGSALDAFRDSLTLYRELGDAKAEAMTLRRMATCYEAIGKMHRAIDSLEDALTLSRRLGDKQNEAATLGDLGNIYRVWGYPEEALRPLKVALSICQDAGECPEQASILNWLGLVYLDLRDYGRARGYFQQALGLYRISNDAHSLAFALNNLGATYNQMGNPAVALPFLEEAHSLAELLGDNDLIAINLCDIAFSQANLKQVSQARDTYQKALAVYRRMGNQRGEAEVLKRIGYLDSLDRTSRDQ
jgi:tetratricopeptide (TPR) repeat protein